MKTPQNMQPSFDDEISIADIILFFKSHKKMILIFVIIGTLLGGLYGNFTEPVYEGSILISPAKFAGAFVQNPTETTIQLGMNAYYSQETFVKCNPQFYKDRDEDNDEEIGYEISDIVKASITKDGKLIQLQMKNKNKTIIKDCLNSTVDNVRTRQQIIADPLIQLKNIDLKLLEEKFKNDVRLLEEKFKNAESFKLKLNDIQITELKTNIERFSVDLVYTNMILSNHKDISDTIIEINKIKRDLPIEINKIKRDLSSEQTKPASNIRPISIEKKNPLSLPLGARMGLFLGLCLGTLIALIKQMKI